MRVYLRYGLRRVSCRACGVVAEAVPWCDVTTARFTTRFEDAVGFLVQRCDTTSVQEMFDSAWVCITSTALGVFAIVPRQGAGNAFPILTSTEDAVGHCLLTANLNSLPVEAVLRQKINGLHLNYFHLKQVAIIPREWYDRALDSESTFAMFVASRVLELTYTAWDLKAFALDCG